MLAGFRRVPLAHVFSLSSSKEEDSEVCHGQNTPAEVNSTPASSATNSRVTHWSQYNVEMLTTAVLVLAALMTSDDSWLTATRTEFSIYCHCSMMFVGFCELALSRFQPHEKRG